MTETRVGGWTRHNCLDEKPKGLTGVYEFAWFDPDEDDDKKVGFTIMSIDKPDADGIRVASDHVFAYRKA